MTFFAYLMLLSSIALIAFAIKSNKAEDKDYTIVALIWIVNFISGIALAMGHLGWVG